MTTTSGDMRDRLRARIASIEAQGRPSNESSSMGAKRFARDDSVIDSEGCASNFEGDKSDGAQAAFRKIVRLSRAREQASVALRRRLAREGFSDEEVDDAIDRAVLCGLVDDRRYADVLVRSRFSQGRGRRGIAAELADLGIDANEVESFAEQDSDGDDAEEIERALALLERRPPQSKNRRDAAYRRLMQKGYSSAVASSAARRWSESHTE